MNFVPTLKHMSSVKILSLMWTRNDTMDYTIMYSPKFCEQCKHAEAEIESSIYAFSIPIDLKKDLIFLSKPVGYEILEWKKLPYQIFPGKPLCNFNKFCWFSNGSVDSKKTAERFVEEESYEVYDRYIVACIYCLEDTLRILYRRLHQAFIFVLHVDQRFPLRLSQLVSLWTTKLTNDEKEVNGINEQDDRQRRFFHTGFKYSVQGGFKVAAEYFLSKIPYPNKYRSLLGGNLLAGKLCEDQFLTSYLHKYRSDTYIHLYFMMNEDVQQGFLKIFPLGIIISTMVWPWYPVKFWRIVNKAWPYLSHVKSYGLLLFIVQHYGGLFELGYKYGSFYMPFMYVWKRFSGAVKQYIINRQITDMTSTLMTDVLLTKDLKCIRPFLSYATSKQRRKLFFAMNSGLNECVNWVKQGEWHLLIPFLRECVASRSVIIRMRKVVRRKKFFRRRGSKIPVEWDRFLQLLDDLLEEMKPVNEESE